jgi:Cft2 family RNA processing exonuclease
LSLEVCILASGSSGNCTLVRTPGGAFLIDAGIGPRVARQRLSGTGAGLDDIRAICLTHLDSDHFRATWMRFVAERDIPVYCSSARTSELREGVQDAYQNQPGAPVDRFCDLVRGFGPRAFAPVPGVKVRALRFDHDEAGSHGFLMECEGARLGWATDLGHVPDQLIEHFQDLDILALESNYDPGLQLASARPWFLGSSAQSWYT